MRNTWTAETEISEKKFNTCIVFNAFAWMFLYKPYCKIMVFYYIEYLKWEGVNIFSGKMIWTQTNKQTTNTHTSLQCYFRNCSQIKCVNYTSVTGVLSYSGMVLQELMLSRHTTKISGSTPWPTSYQSKVIMLFFDFYKIL